ncbi:16S rRNA (cytosine(967)-C(5))-methyltransferase RsmB [Oscillospiraceae bacterium OttesenSCG-928-G22]|nr:16S rRNA (cytosine(967)-C(5))-methyltransferase RsmB [Oscillospiraceae bacterium OttesenSCG-928-G22]
MSGFTGSARRAAYATLLVWMAGDAYPDLRLRDEIRKNRLDERDAAFASHLVYGVIERQMLLDYHIARASSVKLRKLEDRVLCLLRLGAYQLFFSSGVPKSAAVNETVALANSLKNPGAKRYVNAVLRALSAVENPLAVDCPDRVEALSIRESHPRFIVEEYTSLLGEEGAEAALAANNRAPAITVSVNRTRISAEELARVFHAEGVTAEKIPELPDMLRVSETGDLTVLPSYRDGLFFVQDMASRLAVEALAPVPGERLLDVAAAPGGKSFAAGIRMENRGDILACDLHPHKVPLIEAGAARLGLSCIRAECADATEERPGLISSFDRVICDVPCSGLGVIRKKPDIRYKDPEQFSALPGIQRKILANGARYLKPGGRLLYSTCTYRKEENDAVVDRFVDENPGFEFLPFRLPSGIDAPGGKCLLWPHIHGTDGFFICLIGKKDV